MKYIKEKGRKQPQEKELKTHQNLIDILRSRILETKNSKKQSKLSQIDNYQSRLRTDEHSSEKSIKENSYLQSNISQRSNQSQNKLLSEICKRTDKFCILKCFDFKNQGYSQLIDKKYDHQRLLQQLKIMEQQMEKSKKIFSFSKSTLFSVSYELIEYKNQIGIKLTEQRMKDKLQSIQKTISKCQQNLHLYQSFDHNKDSENDFGRIDQNQHKIDMLLKENGIQRNQILNLIKENQSLSETINEQSKQHNPVQHKKFKVFDLDKPLHTDKKFIEKIKELQKTIEGQTIEIFKLQELKKYLYQNNSDYEEEINQKKAQNTELVKRIFQLQEKCEEYQQKTTNLESNINFLTERLEILQNKSKNLHALNSQSQISVEQFLKYLHTPGRQKYHQALIEIINYYQQKLFDINTAFVETKEQNLQIIKEVSNEDGSSIAQSLRQSGKFEDVIF